MANQNLCVVTVRSVVELRALEHLVDLPFVGAEPDADERKAFRPVPCHRGPIGGVVSGLLVLHTARLAAAAIRKTDGREHVHAVYAGPDASSSSNPG